MAAGSHSAEVLGARMFIPVPPDTVFTTAGLGWPYPGLSPAWFRTAAGPHGRGGFFPFTVIGMDKLVIVTESPQWWSGGYRRQESWWCFFSPLIPLPTTVPPPKKKRLLFFFLGMRDCFWVTELLAWFLLLTCPAWTALQPWGSNSHPLPKLKKGYPV